MHSTSNLIFDITTGTFFRYSSAHPGADEFTNLGLAAQTSFTFKLGFEVVQRGSKDQASILLAALNGVDLSAVGTMGDSAVIGTTTQGADITLTLGHDGAYTLAASSGTLDGLDALDVAVRPFSSTFDRTVDGDRDGYEVIYAQSSQANMFNDSTPVEITSVRLSSGDTLYSDGVALQVDAGWVPVSGNVGEIRLVQDGDAQVLEYRDERANSAFQQIVDLTIENGAGETRDLDPIFLFNLGESSAPAPLTTVDVSGTAFPAMMPDLVRLMPLSGQDNVDQDGDGTLDGLTITPTHTAISDGDWNDPHTWASDTVPGDGAIVHIPMGLSVDASGAISDGAHVFMVRVDGTLSVDAPAGTDTTLLVDTIFATHMGTLNIDAADATAGTIDIVIQGYDLDTPPPNWDAATQAYYGPDQDVSGIGANTAVVDDGTGVLGRFAWDPEQVSLGIVSMGTANVAGQDKTAHIEHAGLAAGADSLVVDSALGWGVGDRLLVAGTQYGGDTALTAGLPAGTDSNDDLYAKAGQDEVVRIQSVSDLGNGQVALTFDTALVFDHMPPTFANSDAPDLSVNIANLSRNVTIRSGAATDAADGDIADASSIDRSDPVGQGDDLPDVPLGIGHLIGEPADSPDHHYVTERGHIMFMHTDDVSVANVAFRGLGRTDKTATLDHIAGTLTEDSSSQTNGDVVRDTSGLSAFADPGAITNMTGRYAVHLHQAGTAAGDGDTGALIIGNVVENAVGWGFAQHGSEAILANNVSYDVVGAGFMAETGDETGVWYNNLSVRNTGFMSDQNDPQSQAKTNDIGRNGDAFWTEGRAIAIINNTAVSSKTGFSVQPFGVKQVELETAALSDYQVYFDVVNATFGLTGAAALTVNPDEQNAELALLAHGTDTILQNGFMPIRYFKGNTVLDADTGLSLLTSNEHASRKLNDAWSILSDFTAVHVDKGVFVQYASKYVFEDFNILGLNRPNSNAIELSTSTNEVTAVNWHIEGYLGDAVDQTLRVGIRHANFADHWGPADFTDAFKDQNSSVNGYGPTLAMWDGFAEPINPFLNFYSNSFLDVRVQRAWDDDAFAITAADFTQQRALRVELDYMPEGYNQQTGDFTLIAEDAPAVSDTGVDVDLIFSSKTIGMVAEWREQYNDRGHYAQNFAIDNGDGTYDFEVPLFYFNDEYGERRSGAGPSGYQYNTGPDDVWSGVLVEFDKFDSLGARRYAYDIEAVLDENADQAFEINTGTVVDEDTGETITLESTGNALYRERVTTNERLVFTKDQINATLENNGYSVMDGMTFTDANGTVQDMRFVVIATPLSDRLTGTLEVFRFVVALDENWGADGSIDMDSITNTGQLDRLQDNIVLSDAYGHFRDGVLIGTPVALADSTLADGIVTGGSGNDDITASFVDDPGGDMQTSASDLIYGRGGDDTVRGDRGSDTLYGGDGNDRIYTGRHSDVVFGGDGNDVIVARLTNNVTHTLTGGDGADRFVMSTPRLDRTTDTIITDFDDTEDTFVVAGQVIDFANLPADVLVETMGRDTILTFAENHGAIFIESALPISNGLVEGTDGADVITRQTAVDSGGDLVTTGADTIYGFDGNDTIASHKGSDLVFGGAGDDDIAGFKGSNTLFGGDGDDILNTGRQTSTVFGGAGDDEITAVTNATARHVLSGGDGFDTFNIGAANATRSADITITDFSVARDTLTFMDATGAVQVFDFANVPSDAAGGTTDANGTYVFDLDTDEDGNLTISYGADDVVTLLDVVRPINGANNVEGTGRADRIDRTYEDVGGGRVYVENADGVQQTVSQTIFAGAGDDEVFTYKGSDTVYGGAGDDSVASSNRNDQIFGGTGNDSLLSGNGAALFGGDGDDFLTASTQKQTTYKPGSSTNGFHDLTGGDGADIFVIGGPLPKNDANSHTVIRDFDVSQDDQLVVQGTLIDLNAPLPDWITATSGPDYVVLDIYETAPDPDGPSSRFQIYLDGITTLGPDGIVEGTQGDDTMALGYSDAFGDAITDSGNVIEGLGGNDHIVAGRGADAIYGGDGADKLFANRGNDVVFGGAGNDLLFGQKGANELHGGAGNDYLNTGQNGSVVDGGTGNDRIIASLKKNADHVLTGGDGADTFEFLHTTASRATQSRVTDFDQAVDVLKIEGVTIDLNAPPPEYTVDFAADGLSATLSIDSDSMILLTFG